MKVKDTGRSTEWSRRLTDGVQGANTPYCVRSTLQGKTIPDNCPQIVVVRKPQASDQQEGEVVCLIINPSLQAA
jgi:hypothetical protein